MRDTVPILALDWQCEPPDVAARWPRDQPLLWLHSGRVHPRWARWSILASPAAVFRCGDTGSTLTGESPPALANVSFTHDPLRDLDTVLRATALETSALARSSTPFRGGWIGYLSYDLGRIIEPAARRDALAPVNREARWPLIELAWCPDPLVFDHVHRRWSAIGDIPSSLRGSGDSAPAEFHLGEIKADIAPPVYESMVARTIQYIAAGDIFQANIAQTFRAAFEGSTRALAIAAFREAQPWYGAYLELEANVRRTALLSLSPELFLQSDPLARRIVTRPIKGTRPASCDARDLLDSAKDQAELNMIVDLMRNDLGRVCEFGSVRVPQPRAIESHPTVHHGVAEITGRLRPNVSVGDVLAATFPAGSVSGAPKIRAMQIIDELESPHILGGRGPYCGAVGFISDCGAMTLNVAIRTLLLRGRQDGHRVDGTRDGEVMYSAGAGIVADSIPAREHLETLDKAAVLRLLAEMSQEPARRDRRLQMT